MKDAHSANRTKNHFSDFSDFLFWVIADCIYNLPKNFRSKCSNLQEGCRLLWKWFFSSWVFFLCDFQFLRCDRFCIWSTISQKLSHTKKTPELRNYFQKLFYLSWKVGHFCTIFFRQIKSGRHFDPVTIKDMQIPPHSEVVNTLKTLWKMWNVLISVG